MAYISIIVPCYNVSSFIERLIESVLSQTYKDWELILVDDGSKDNTVEICNQFCNNDNRIRLLRQKNSGASSARNLGLKKATGEYVCFIDADDWVEPTYLANMISASISETDLVVGGMRERNDRYVKDWATHMKSFSRVSFKDALTCKEFGQLLLGPVAKLFKREIISSFQLAFPENVRVGEDRIFVYNYLKHCKQVIFNGNVDYNYERRLDSLSKDRMPFKIAFNDYCAAEKLLADTKAEYQIPDDCIGFLAEIKVFHLERLLCSLMEPIGIIERAKHLKSIDTEFLWKHNSTGSIKMKVIYTLLHMRLYFMTSLIISLNCRR